MPDSRARRDRGLERDEALGTQWATALRAGASLDALSAEVGSIPPARAAAGIRALGSIEDAHSLTLLTAIARSPHRELAEVAVETLGRIPTPVSAAVLAEIEGSAADKAVQKAARRSLHWLSSQGIRVEPSERAVPLTIATREATIYRVIASPIDGSGTRSLWFAAERPRGGIFMIAAAVNDVRGLLDLAARDTTRKRFAEREATLRANDVAAWVELPVEYAKQLVKEAVDNATEAGERVPPSYAPWAQLIGHPAEPFPEALVYREIRPVEVLLHPTLEQETGELFSEPEVEPWFFRPERVRTWTRQIAEPPSSRLIVRPESERERQDRIVREAIAELLPPRELLGLKRRLEETAYIFLRTEREQAARRAVAAAATVEERRPLRPTHPFLRVLMLRSVAIALEVDRSEIEPVGLALLPR
ncbi:MAG: hypothetical protein GEU73_02825 [Chloroflexi bacterium]|nr:hypothetical protein [Chloroflexota bacterium]